MNGTIQIRDSIFKVDFVIVQGSNVVSGIKVFDDEQFQAAVKSCNSHISAQKFCIEIIHLINKRRQLAFSWPESSVSYKFNEPAEASTLLGFDIEIEFWVDNVKVKEVDVDSIVLNNVLHVKNVRPYISEGYYKGLISIDNLAQIKKPGIKNYVLQKTRTCLIYNPVPDILLSEIHALCIHNNCKIHELSNYLSKFQYYKKESIITGSRGVRHLAILELIKFKGRTYQFKIRSVCGHKPKDLIREELYTTVNCSRCNVQSLQYNQAI